MAILSPDLSYRCQTSCMEIPRALRDRLNWFRFSYHRSLRRATPAQLRRVSTNYFARPPSKYPRRLVSIGLTHRCQNRCGWCATGSYRSDAVDELTTSEVELLLERIARSRFVFNNVSFLGGECLLRPDLPRLVEHAASLGLCVHISTNGLKLDDSCVNSLVRAGLNSVFVAWPTATTVDPRELARRERVRCGILRCLEHELPCFLSVCVCRDDVSNGALARTIEFARDLGVDGVRLLPIRLAGKWLHEPMNRTLTLQEEREVRRLCRDGFAYVTDDAREEAGRTCQAAARRILYVSPYGEVQPCHFFPFAFGDVRQNAFDDVLERMWRHELIKVACDGCLLHDTAFRARYILPLDPSEQLPIMM